MKFLFALLPVILFFAAYKFAGSHADAALHWARHVLGDSVMESQAPILIATAVAILATFGQIAWVWLRHRKVDTMLWVSLAIVTVFGVATLFFHDPIFIKWKPTVLYWLFAATLAAYRFSEETWVNFKLFGGMGLMLLFVLAQGLFLSKHLQEETK